MDLVHYDDARWGARPGLQMVADESGVVRDDQGKKAEYLVLHRSSEGEAGQFQMALIRYPEARSYPQHRHKTDQIRLVLNGSEPFAPGRATPTGSILYISSGTPYGPGSRTAGEEILSIEQYGADAVFFATEPVGPKGVLARRRYASPVELDPAAFTWRKVAPGVTQKRLGTFTERATRLSMLALEPGSEHVLVVDQPMLGFVVAGHGQLGSEPLGERDSFRAEPGEELPLRSVDRLELFLVGMPSYDAASRRSSPVARTA